MHVPVSGECAYRQDLLRNVGKVDQRVLAHKYEVDAHAYACEPVQVVEVVVSGEKSPSPSQTRR